MNGYQIVSELFSKYETIQFAGYPVKTFHGKHFRKNPIARKQLILAEKNFGRCFADALNKQGLRYTKNYTKAKVSKMIPYHVTFFNNRLIHVKLESKLIPGSLLIEIKDGKCIGALFQ